MEEIQPIVREKDEIEFTDESKLLGYLDSSENENSEARMKAVLCLVE